MNAYGAWTSPITPELVAASSVSIGEPSVCNGVLYWLESRPAEEGRITLLRKTKAGVEELTPAPYSVRSRVHEYGGGAYLATEKGVFFVNNKDQNLHQINEGGNIRPVTHSSADRRYADLCHDAAGRRMIAVTEIHQRGGQSVERTEQESIGEPENALVLINIESGRTTLLHRGRDFYASPRLSPDGKQLLFIAWDHPNMPWDGTQLLRCRLEDDRLDQLAVVAGGAQESVMQPSWTANGDILYITDQGGFWNIHQLSDSTSGPALTEAADYGGPPWQFGQRSYVCLTETLIAACRHSSNGQDLILIDRANGFVTPLLENCAAISHLSAHADALYFLAAKIDAPAALVRLDPKTRQQITLAQPPPIAVAQAHFSRPEHIVYPTRDGANAYAYVYRPHHAQQHDAKGKPPLLVLCHGGPTGAATPALNLLIQFYTSRGWMVADVDYRGSSGYGRAYREALNGRWGLLDATDCEDAVRHLAAQGEVDLARVAIRGRSAGGYTTLRALTTSSVFRAGASHYGIGDLAAMAQDTHKFESRYLDLLLGTTENIRARSPIHHLDGFSCPVIFFQGGEDTIVLPNQAQAMVAALRRKGLPVAYLEFAKEGHGFRDGGNIAHCIGAEYAFYCRVMGLPQPQDMPEAPMEGA